MLGQRLFSLVLLAVVIWFLIVFPVGQLWLAIGFAVYAVLLLKFPRLWLVVVPAAMPLLDLAIFSGWYFFDEFDALVLLTVANLLWRQRLRVEDFRVGWPLAIVLSILIVSYIVSIAIVLIPWPVIDGNAFASYYSPFNAARIAKGFVWPLLLLPYLNQAINSSSSTGRYLVSGLLLGLFGVVLVSLYEHWLFVGAFNFGSDYRIIGPFSSMHTGDGHIDLWLAVTIPLIVAPFLRHWNIGWRLAAPVLAGLAFYVLLATISRGPFLATGVAIFFMLCSFALVWALRGRFAKTLLLYPMIGVLLAVAAVPFVVPTQLGNRFKLTGDDFQARMSHFREALAIRDSGAVTQWFGMGLGTFPKTYEQRHVGPYPLARYSFDGYGRQRFLTLNAGDNLYISQKVDAAPETRYLFSFGYRTRDSKAALAVSVCEKWLLHSGRCSRNYYRLTATDGKWIQYSAIIDTKEVGSPPGSIGNLSKRPIRIAMWSGHSGDALSLDDFALVTPDGRNLIKNGNFNDTNDYWFWTVDNHLPWHTKNLAVNVLFDQGWLGMAGVILICGLCLVALARAVWAGRSEAVPWIGAMIGYLVVAVVASPFDQPRLAMLFYLICLLCTLQYAPRRLNSADEPV